MRKSANTCTRDLRREFEIEEFCGKRRIDLSLFLFSKEISEISKLLLPESKDDAFLNVIGALGSEIFAILRCSPEYCYHFRAAASLPPPPPPLLADAFGLFFHDDDDDPMRGSGKPDPDRKSRVLTRGAPAMLRSWNWS